MAKAAVEVAERANGQREEEDLENMHPDEKVSIMVQVPAGLKLAVKNRADAEGENGVSISFWVRKLLADTFDYELPAQQRRARPSKYATEEERKAAQREATAKRNEKIRKLMKLYRENPEMFEGLDDDDDGDDDE